VRPDQPVSASKVSARYQNHLESAIGKIGEKEATQLI
jgi:hypothetical protein